LFPKDKEATGDSLDRNYTVVGLILRIIDEGCLDVGCLVFGY